LIIKHVKISLITVSFNSARTIGDTGGAETKDMEHAHTISHTHDLAHSGANNLTGGAPAIVVNTADPTGNPLWSASTGSGYSQANGGTDSPSSANSGDALSATEDVMNPFIVFTYIIKY